MSRSRTLTAMILDCRQRVNQENSTFILDSEITELLNQELARLWTHIVQGQGQPFYRSAQPYTVTPSTSLQPLPADFYQVQEVTATMGGYTGSLRPFMASEHGWLQNSGFTILSTATKYRIQAGNIEFLPVQQNFTAQLYYSPTQPRLVSGSDVFDGFAGWEVAAIYGTCAAMLAKEESDPGFYQGLRAEIYHDIDAQIAQRDASAPERVQDVMGHAHWPWGGR